MALPAAPVIFHSRLCRSQTQPGLSETACSQLVRRWEARVGGRVGGGVGGWEWVREGFDGGASDCSLG